MKPFLFVILMLFCISSTIGDKPHKKYSKDANKRDSSEERDDKFVRDIEEPNFRTLRTPFRMAKLNLVWSKAQHRLTEPKLRSLFTELKIQDKEELAWKQLNSQHKDKDGLKEAELRKKLVGIMSTYDLLEHFDETQDPEKVKHHKAFSGPVDDKYKNKSLFKDKKLNKLWEKAEVSGFSPQELAALKEEFEHHQQKIDLYYELLDKVGDGHPPAASDPHPENMVNDDEHETFNEINFNLETNEIEKTPKKDHSHKVNQLREKHRELKDGYDRLERVASKGPNSEDFVEPKIQGLWRVALASNFTADELASLKIELLHYESRLLKLRHMHAEHALVQEKQKVAKSGDKVDQLNHLEETIKKQTRKVEKIAAEVEKKVFQHTEL
ncbi:alpha-2-macroglobulin receptor-associated protein [Culicoides brevitarsis]|uniref:alpha-2-macroglobulin receptor-associated protein n=1 Tax=Culicoides brevitarsis TaxID=469753 RepID=UPI00307B7FA4